MLIVVVLGMFTEAVTVVGPLEIGISKMGIDVVSAAVAAPLLLLLLLLPTAFFFFDPPVFVPVAVDFPSLALLLMLVNGGGNPAATACAFISFCRFSACDLACFRR